MKHNPTLYQIALSYQKYQGNGLQFFGCT